MQDRPDRTRRLRTGEVDRRLEDPPDLQGHRGARGKFPENTIPAFQYAIEQRMTSIELDVNLTKDRQLLVYHDTAVNTRLCCRETGESAAAMPIRELSVAELKRLDCGARVDKAFPEQQAVKGAKLLTLAEFFHFVKDFEQMRPRASPIRFNIEVKFWKGYGPADVKTMAELTVATIAAAGVIERSAVQSFVLGILPEVRKLNSRIRTAAIFEPGPVQKILLKTGFGIGRAKIIRRTLEVAADTIVPHILYVDRDFIARCHHHRRKVVPWVVNDESKMKALLQWGVDGIISDYPDRLQQAYMQWAAKG